VAEVGARVGADRYTKVGEAGRPGVVTDVTVIHPLTGARLPLVVADYVLPDYGTGVVMGVPAHDERDFAFATALGLPVVQVIEPDRMAGSYDGTAAWPGEGTLVASADFTGLGAADARARIADRLGDGGVGRPVTRYRLQDWLVSRQRYWGSPIPIIYCGSCGTVPVPEADLPVELPDVTDFRPAGTGLSPLATCEEFVNVACPECGGPGRRETDVVGTFVEASRDFLRYPSRPRPPQPSGPPT